MPRVVHFEFVSDHPDRACRFYADLFGIKESDESAGR